MFGGGLHKCFSPEMGLYMLMMPQYPSVTEKKIGRIPTHLKIVQIEMAGRKSA